MREVPFKHPALISVDIIYNSTLYSWEIPASDGYWKYNTAERKQPRRFPEDAENYFLQQLISEPSRGGALLDMLKDLGRQNPLGVNPEGQRSPGKLDALKKK